VRRAPTRAAPAGISIASRPVRPPGAARLVDNDGGANAGRRASCSVCSMVSRCWCSWRMTSSKSVPSPVPCSAIHREVLRANLLEVGARRPAVEQLDVAADRPRVSKRRRSREVSCSSGRPRIDARARGLRTPRCGRGPTPAAHQGECWPRRQRRTRARSAQTCARALSASPSMTASVSAYADRHAKQATQSGWRARAAFRSPCTCPTTNHVPTGRPRRRVPARGRPPSGSA
jgi:hypothetical protein